jgi:hypothetical protein
MARGAGEKENDGNKKARKSMFQDSGRNYNDI